MFKLNSEKFKEVMSSRAQVLTFQIFGSKCLEKLEIHFYLSAILLVPAGNEDGSRERVAIFVEKTTEDLRDAVHGERLFLHDPARKKTACRSEERQPTREPHCGT